MENKDFYNPSSPTSPYASVNPYSPQPQRGYVPLGGESDDNPKRKKGKGWKTITIILLVFVVILGLLLFLSMTSLYGSILPDVNTLKEDNNNASIALSDAEYAYQVASARLTEATEALSTAKNLYASAVTSYEEAKAQAEEAKTKYEMAVIAEETAAGKYAEASETLDTAVQNFQSATARCEDLKSAYESATSKLKDATSAMNTAKSAYTSAAEIYNALSTSEGGKIPEITTEAGAKEVFAKIADAVEEIRNYDVTETYVSLGSGFIFDKSGLVCTNYHVISGAEELRVQYGEGDDDYYKVAYVLGFDKDIDLAILQLEEREEDYPTIALAETEPEPGDTVYALGSNTGFFKTYSRGIVSMVEKEIEEFPTVKYIQYVSMTHSGNSGCAIVNSDGEAVAVHQLGDGQYGDNGFGIPIRYLKEIARDKKLSPMEATYAGAVVIDTELLRYETKTDVKSGGKTVTITGFKSAEDVSDLVTDEVVAFPSTIDDYPVTQINMSFLLTDVYAEYHYYFVKHIVIPEGVTALMGNVFYYAPETLLTIKLPSTLTFIGEDVFSTCFGIYRIYMDGGGNDKVYLEDEVLYGKDKDDKLALLRYPLCKSNFGDDLESSDDDGKLATKSFAVPADVQFIVDFACIYSGFSELTFPDRNSESSLQIGSLAFCFNQNLESVSIPVGTTFIGPRAFGACLGLKSVTFEGDIDSIGEIYEGEDSGMYYGAFDSCIAIESITFMGSVKLIGDRAFLGAVITALKLPSGMESLGKAAFARCDKLISVDLTDYAPEALSYSLFNYCDVLKTVTFNSGLKKIDDYAFANCLALSSITIPGEVTEIGDYAFYLDSKLGTVVFPKTPKLETIGIYAFFNCDALTSFVIPDTVKVIGKYAFSNLDGLIDLVIPEGVKVIAEGLVFNNSKMESITLPSTVTRIADGAFWECPKLTSITLNTTLPPFITEVMIQEEDAVPEDFELIVFIPSGSTAAYIADSAWRYFASFENITFIEK